MQVRLQDETVWLTQKLLAELFGKDVRTINEHIQNIFQEGELAEDSVVRKFRITAADGKNYATKFYNLDVIISVGYRVKSLRGTQFRIWATQRLRIYDRYRARRFAEFMPSVTGSSRREEAHSKREGDQSLVTSAATTEGRLPPLSARQSIASSPMKRAATSMGLAARGIRRWARCPTAASAGRTMPGPD